MAPVFSGRSIMRMENELKKLIVIAFTALMFAGSAPGDERGHTAGHPRWGSGTTFSTIKTTTLMNVSLIVC